MIDERDNEVRRTIPDDNNNTVNISSEKGDMRREGVVSPDMVIMPIAHGQFGI